MVARALCLQRNQGTQPVRRRARGAPGEERARRLCYVVAVAIPEELERAAPPPLKLAQRSVHHPDPIQAGLTDSE